MVAVPSSASRFSLRDNEGRSEDPEEIGPELGPPLSEREQRLASVFANPATPSTTKIAALFRAGALVELTDLLMFTMEESVAEGAIDILTEELTNSGEVERQRLEDFGYSVPAEIIYPRRSIISAAEVAWVFAAPDFDPTSEGVRRWVGSRVTALKVVHSDASREAIYNALNRAIVEDMEPRKLAHLIKQHIGLDPRRSLAVDNYRRRLLSLRERMLDPKKLEKLRTKKSIVKFLQKGGFVRKEWRVIPIQGMSDRRVNNMVNEYATRLRMERATAIAETEINLARNRGQEMAWEQAAEQGAFPKGLPMRKWVTRGDGRVCPRCRAMAGKLAPIGGGWDTPSGPVSSPSLHSRCRCGETLVDPAPPKKIPKRTKFALEIDAITGDYIENEEHCRRVGERLRREVNKKSIVRERRLRKTAKKNFGKKADLRELIEKESAGGWKTIHDHLGMATVRVHPDQAKIRKLIKQMAAIEKRNVTINKQLGAIRADTLNNLLRQVRPMGGKTPFTKGADPRQVAALNKALERYPRDWVDASARGGEMAISKAGYHLNGLRGYYNHAAHEISLGSWGDHEKAGWKLSDIRLKYNSTALHEMGHRFAHTVPEIMRLEAEFYARRTELVQEGFGRQWNPAHVGTGYGYGLGESLRDGGFVSEYIGKDYGSWMKDVSKRRSGYEVASMGFQELLGGFPAGDLKELHLDDADMADFILGLLAGVK